MEGVDELAEHERRLVTGAYRPDGCWRCGQPVHVHDRRPRVLAGHMAGSTEIARFRCSDREGCGAVWQVLPRLLARHLWRAWRTVEAAVVEPVQVGVAEVVPARTRRRWRARLASSAALVVSALSEAFAGDAVAEVALARGASATRGELVVIVAGVLGARTGQRLSRLAELIHRCASGVRLM